ncbi:hypothetical protein CC78DRAFT_37776 [Lojkania enalia]|uniref:Uncharacterized protein n=1 Tax=Lojkania enalia TaxID=147567 RepID=A0A9P4N655_9PLEO|nr:hypothetical protein CC78DRAFT_37776 [Didymosphaeria enalia]
MENTSDPGFTLVAFGYTLSCPQFNSFTELNIFVSSELRARKLDDRALEIINSGNFTLTTRKVCVLNEEALSQVMPGQIVALAQHSGEQYLSPLRNMTPVVDRKKMMVFGDSIIELSNYDLVHGLEACLTREYWTQYHVIKHGFSFVRRSHRLSLRLPEQGNEYKGRKRGSSILPPSRRPGIPDCSPWN